MNYELPKTNDAIEAGDSVYWDADGDPVNGPPGSGAACLKHEDLMMQVFLLTTGDGRDGNEWSVEAIYATQALALRLNTRES